MIRGLTPCSNATINADSYPGSRNAFRAVSSSRTIRITIRAYPT
nr:MAG TPA: hypothetical protein [Caudoviricetes sp.]